MNITPLLPYTKPSTPQKKEPLFGMFPFDKGKGKEKELPLRDLILRDLSAAGSSSREALSSDNLAVNSLATEGALLGGELFSSDTLEKKNVEGSYQKLLESWSKKSKKPIAVKSFFSTLASRSKKHPPEKKGEPAQTFHNTAFTFEQPLPAKAAAPLPVGLPSSRHALSPSPFSSRPTHKLVHSINSAGKGETKLTRTLNRLSLLDTFGVNTASSATTTSSKRTREEKEEDLISVSPPPVKKQNTLNQFGLLSQAYSETLQEVRKIMEPVLGRPPEKVLTPSLEDLKSFQKSYLTALGTELKGHRLQHITLLAKNLIGLRFLIDTFKTITVEDKNTGKIDQASLIKINSELEELKKGLDTAQQKLLNAKVVTQEGLNQLFSQVDYL